jgi:hypothetical protein
MASTNRRRLHHWILPLGCLSVGLWGLPVVFAAPENPANLPELVRTTQRVFAIPFRLPKPATADAAAQRVEMSVSQDFGLSWQVAGTASPQESSIPYRAGADGEYWFRIRSFDKQERARGSEGPDVRVLVDAAPPRLDGRVWKGEDGEIICRYAAADDSIKLDQVRLEYRQGGTPWKPVAAQPVLSRQSPAHLVGEEIWWAGQDVNDLTVRITVADLAGHTTTRQFSLLPSDPGISQAQLAREIHSPALPGEKASLSEDQAPEAHSVMVSASRKTNRLSLATEGPWRAESAANWSRGESPDHEALTLPTTASFAQPVGSRRPVQQTIKVAAPTLSEAVTNPSGVPAEYRGRPLHLMRSREFMWDYNFEAPEDLHGPFRAELWITLDAGGSWQRAAIDDDTISPIAVTLPGDGLYGCRLEIVRDAPGEPISPRSGVDPTAWIGVDETPPQVSTLEVKPADDAASGEFVITYRCEDPLGLPDSVRLSYSPHPTGPWATIASSQPATGSYCWQPHRSLPGRVFVRVEMSDAAGNVGEQVSAQPVTVRTARFVGTLGSPRLPSPEAKNR